MNDLNVYEYIDYRKYLRDYFEAKKASSASFSFATFARKAGIQSRATAKLVLDGKRNLGLESVPKFCKGLGLGARESKYFLALVRFSHAKSVEDKNESYRALLSFTERRKFRTLGEAQHRLYAHWYYPAIQEMVLLKGFPRSQADRAEWLKERLGSGVTTRQVDQALTDLRDLGLLRDGDSGTLAQATPFYSSTDGPEDFALQGFHKKMIEQALASIDRPLDERDVSGVTLAISREDLPAALAAIREFRRKFNFDFSVDRDADEVWELNLQFFRLAQAATGAQAKPRRDPDQVKPATTSPFAKE